MNYQAPGAPMVLYMETLKKEQGADWVRVPFRGGGEAVNAILSGTTPIGLFGEGNVIGQIRAGKMTPLVMMNNIRSPNFPDVPLLKEVGYNGEPSRSWYGIFAPAGTPRPIVDRLNKEIVAIISDPGFRERHLTARSLVAAANSPEQFAEEIKRDRAGGEEGGEGRRLRAAVMQELRHGRACPGHPRLPRVDEKDVDARAERGHDERAIIA